MLVPRRGEDVGSQRWSRCWFPEVGKKFVPRRVQDVSSRRWSRLVKKFTEVVKMFTRSVKVSQVVKRAFLV